MEFKRKIYEKLLAWKSQSNGKTALLIEGARRVGKSTIAERFGKEQYKSYILIDFRIASKIIINNFYDNLLPNKLNDFFNIIKTEYGKELYERESLIIFDEVQRFPKAREAIKDLVKDGRYDYIETGSLISIKENVKDIVIPSEEKKIQMYPMDFEEFLIAENEIQLLEYIKECASEKKPLIDAFHKRASYCFKEYLLVGGMPQSVLAYLENNKDFNKADEAKREILDLYRDDINKASRRYSLKISHVFDNIPGFLSKHDKKIVLSNIDNKKTFSEYADPLFWLDDSMICNLCYKCNDPNIGFSLAKDDSSVKCYLGDTGLLISLAFSENEIVEKEIYKSILHDKLSINKGMIYENIVAQMLKAKGNALYFYTHYSLEAHKNDIEIDFLLSNSSKTNLKVYPLEVKSSKNYTTSSYDLFKKRFGKRIETSYIVHPKQLVIESNSIKMPPYLLPFILLL